MDDEKLKKDVERLKPSAVRSSEAVERLKVLLARSYRAHEKAGCTGCDLCREILEAVQTRPVIAGVTGPPTALRMQLPTWILELVEHKTSCGYPKTACTCPTALPEWLQIKGQKSAPL
jgi:hypothetical protein